MNINNYECLGSEQHLDAEKFAPYLSSRWPNEASSCHGRFWGRAAAFQYQKPTTYSPSTNPSHLVSSTPGKEVELLSIDS
jgi:hypothetical protein